MTTLEKKVDALVRLHLCDDMTERSDILKSLREMTGDIEKPPAPDYHTKAVNALLELGTPDHIKGHKFLVYAVELVIENPDILEQITKVLYPTVAEKFNDTPSRVERAIRHAIEVTWDRADLSTIDKYFGSTISRHKGKPTNSEFLARMANALR